MFVWSEGNTDQNRGHKPSFGFVNLMNPAICFICAMASFVILSQNVSQTNKNSLNTFNLDVFKTNLGSLQRQNFMHRTSLPQYTQEPPVQSFLTTLTWTDSLIIFLY